MSIWNQLVKWVYINIYIYSNYVSSWNLFFPSKFITSSVFAIKTSAPCIPFKLLFSKYCLHAIALCYWIIGKYRHISVMTFILWFCKKWIPIVHTYCWITWNWILLLSRRVWCPINICVTLQTFIIK